MAQGKPLYYNKSRQACVGETVQIARSKLNNLVNFQELLIYFIGQSNINKKA